MGSPINPPNTPPTPPVIPEGLATILMKYGTLVFFVLGVVIYIFDIDLDLEELLAAGAGAVSLWTLAAGRYYQAGKFYQ